MNSNLNVSLIQTNLFWQNAKKNIEVFDSKINLVSQSTDLIILPEMFTTGFSLEPQNIAENMNGDSVNWLINKANQNNVALAGSIIISENNQFFNRFIFAKPDKSFDFYDKRHLFRMANEHLKFTAGQNKVISNLNGWRIRLLVCYDLRFPVWSRNQNDYDLIVYVANWPKPRISQWEILLKARAIENQCYTIGVNRIGFDGNNTEYSGNSLVISPKGEIMAQANDNEDCIINAELDFELLQKYRENFPVSLDADNFEIKL